MQKNTFSRKNVLFYLGINTLITVLLISSALFLIVPRVSAATGCFPDTNGHWAETFICWLSDNNIAGGYPDGTYRPENNVTRAELAVMFNQYHDQFGGGSGGGDYYTQAEVDALLASRDSRIADLETLLDSVSLENGGDDFVFTGVNVHVRDGSGDTDGLVTGLGNLIVGYNEDSVLGGYETRTGSHNLVLGYENEYTSYGGMVVGKYNEISGPCSTISGGIYNTSSGLFTSVSGGQDNTANGFYASISGGAENIANNSWASISGGYGNTASGEYSSVSGGYDNTANGDRSSINGGYSNSANGLHSSISGGYQDTVSGTYDWRAGDEYFSED